MHYAQTTPSDPSVLILASAQNDEMTSQIRKNCLLCLLNSFFGQEVRNEAVKENNGTCVRRRYTHGCYLWSGYRIN